MFPESRLALLLPLLQHPSGQGPAFDPGEMGRPTVPLTWLEVDVDLGFALFFLFLLCFFLLVTIVRCAYMVRDPYGSISTSTYQEEQITN
ncbi:hypothetical protein AAFF_G00238330 [Aldrovandia affinis]|uniref:Uncharacterized protein n=1 Tax=Aldrovandia affinis TaxID=143900 RepID=A0AAD7W3Z0_9TELE|nr:hypothetical protein AAFF_G00238330 [Aldrovandia affinis]